MATLNKNFCLLQQQRKKNNVQKERNIMIATGW